MKITQKIMKKFLGFKLLRSIPGRIRLKSRAPKGFYKEAEPYDRYLKETIMLLDGIVDIEVNYKIGTVLIKYDISKTYESKILKWINKIIEVGLKNQEDIMEYWDTNFKYLEKMLEQQLKEEVEKL